MRLLTDQLFQQVLIEPAERNKANKMLAVSGYVTANMVYKHMESLDERGCHPSIDVVAGMVPMQGIDKAHHEQFVKFSQEGVCGCNFSCSYATTVNPVHAKVFIWMRDNTPLVAFAGSANYTARGFGENQNEIMTPADPHAALDFYTQTAEQAICCFDDDVKSKITLKTQRRRDYTGINAELVTLSLLDSNSRETHKKSGLNWGQRPGRNPNQAYIPVSSKIAKGGFFPSRGQPFTVRTDDGFSFVLVVAQQGNKALHSTHDNSILGSYFRRRLKIQPGQYVEKKHLLEYGRTDVTFAKIDYENYFMDFKKPKK